MPDLKDPFTMVYGVTMMLFEALIPTPAEQSYTVVGMNVGIAIWETEESAPKDRL